MRVVAELAIAVVDGDVVSKRMMPVILLQPQIVRVGDSRLHRHHAASRAGRDIERVQAVSPMRERSVRPLRDDPRNTRRGREFIALCRDQELCRTAGSLIGTLHDNPVLVRGQPGIVHHHLIRPSAARLQTCKVPPASGLFVFRDQYQRARLKILAAHREIDLLRAFAGPGNASYDRPAVVIRRRNREPSRKRHRAVCYCANRPVPGFGRLRESRDRQLRGETQLARARQFAIFGGGGHRAGRVQPLHA